LIRWNDKNYQIIWKDWIGRQKKSSAGALFKSTESLQKPVRQKIHQQ
jgi:hypothetical protein